MKDLTIVKAHEDFVQDLKTSGLNHTIIRPTGYFSDIGEYFKMVESGRAYLIGKGENRLNPIHGSDFARVCVEAVQSQALEIPAGGPTAFSQREITELAFSSLCMQSKISSIPVGLAKFVTRLIRIFNSHSADLLDFFVSGAEQDMVAPAYGTQELADYFSKLSTKDR